MKAACYGVAIIALSLGAACDLRERHWKAAVLGFAYAACNAVIFLWRPE